MDVRELTDTAFAERLNTDSIIKPYLLSHGTLECHSLAPTRAFYEEFLGLDVVQHSPVTMVLRCGFKFHVVCLAVGDNLRPCTIGNHWGLDLDSREAVDRAHAACHQYREKYNIGTIEEPNDQHGSYSFYFEDLDQNWWECQYVEGLQNDDMFDFGDRFNPDGTPV